MAFSGDGEMVLAPSVTGPINVWDASNGALLASLSEIPGVCNTGHSTCFSACGGYVATASDDKRGVLLWRISDWSCIARVDGDEEVTHIAISLDGRVLCWGTVDGRVFFRRIHDLVSADQD